MFGFARSAAFDGPPETLESRTMEAVASRIKSGKVKRVVVLTGAGISTAAGIPDFRSPRTGIYANLKRLNLPEPQAVFDISFFRQRPEPFYVLAKELYPGKFHPTVSHAFIALLAKKGLLHMNFTQNIDCLERRGGVPADKIIEAHGSFATQRCIECREPYPDDQMIQNVESEVVPRCAGCKGLVKPDIVFFGEPLPSAFNNKAHMVGEADLVIVIGTSLSVFPFSSLPQRVSKGVPRLLLNKQRVGDFGSRSDDVIGLGACDAGVRKLADLIGWADELDRLWRSLVGDREAELQLARGENEDVVDDSGSSSEDEATGVDMQNLTGLLNRVDLSDLLSQAEKFMRQASLPVKTEPFPSYDASSSKSGKASEEHAGSGSKATDPTVESRVLPHAEPKVAVQSDEPTAASATPAAGKEADLGKEKEPEVDQAQQRPTATVSAGTEKEADGIRIEIEGQATAEVVSTNSTGSRSKEPAANGREPS